MFFYSLANGEESHKKIPVQVTDMEAVDVLSVLSVETVVAYSVELDVSDGTSNRVKDDFIERLEQSQTFRFRSTYLSR